jgi:hypothetical protein
MQMEFWQVLLAGLLGALVGGALSIIGSIIGTKMTARSALKLWAQQQHKSELRSRQAAVRNLLAEIRDNLRLSQSAPSNHTLVALLVDSWEAYKGTIEFLSPAIQESVRKGYGAAVLANSFVMKDLYHGKHGLGYYEEDYKAHVQEMVNAFQEAETELSDWV